MQRRLYVKLKDRMSNRVCPDETAHYELSHLDLCCVQKIIIIGCGSERVNNITVLLMSLALWTGLFLFEGCPS